MLVPEEREVELGPRNSPTDPAAAPSDERPTTSQSPRSPRPKVPNSVRPVAVAPAASTAPVWGSLPALSPMKRTRTDRPGAIGQAPIVSLMHSPGMTRRGAGGASGAGATGARRLLPSNPSRSLPRRPDKKSGGRPRAQMLPPPPGVRPAIIAMPSAAPAEAPPRVRRHRSGDRRGCDSTSVQPDR